MRKFFVAALVTFAFTSISTGVGAEPVKKEDLMSAPDDARHYVISSSAGKHGDIWSWKLADGSVAYRMSMSLRGWITETDETIAFNPEGEPVRIAIRGFTDSGDATENFYVDDSGVAHWKTAVDEGSAPMASGRARFQSACRRW